MCVCVCVCVHVWKPNTVVNQTAGKCDKSKHSTCPPWPEAIRGRGTHLQGPLIFVCWVCTHIKSLSWHCLLESRFTCFKPFSGMVIYLSHDFIILDPRPFETKSLQANVSTVYSGTPGKGPPCRKATRSGAVWESRWMSWAVCPNEPSGFHGRKDLLNRASALVTTCP